MLNVITTAAIIALVSTPSFADGDAEAGGKVFNKCKACHAVGPDAKNKVGPALNGIVDASAGQADFKYSSAMLEAAEAGLVWDEETLTAFLQKPSDVVKGTKMSFPGLRKEEEIENVIAYLRRFE